MIYFDPSQLFPALSPRTWGPTWNFISLARHTNTVLLTPTLEISQNRQTTEAGVSSAEEMKSPPS